LICLADNHTAHLTKNVEKWWNAKGITLITNAQYTPQNMMVEIAFGSLKKIISKKNLKIQ
jgi:hypothetical protein